jgi:hypothetical protein
VDHLHKLHTKRILLFLTQGLELSKHNLSYVLNQAKFNREERAQFIVVQVNPKLQ